MLSLAHWNQLSSMVFWKMYGGSCPIPFSAQHFYLFLKDCLTALAKVEEAYKHEKQTKEAIEEMIQRCSLYQIQDTLDAGDEGTDENRLLPAMNKIWPFLVVCIQNRNTVVSVHSIILAHPPNK